MDELTNKAQCAEGNDPVQLQYRIRKIVNFLEIYRWIIEAYISDFFVLGHWRKLPASWQSILSQLSPPDLACIIDKGEDCHDKRHVWPLSLLCYKACIDHLSLDRQEVDVGRVDIAQRLDRKSPTNSHSTHSTQSAPKVCGTDEKQHVPATSYIDSEQQGVGFFCGQYRDLYHIYRRHVKPKKQHEIHQLGQVIRQLSQLCGSNRIVDVGAGLGHLSRLLTFGLGFKVTTMEASEGHAPKATTFDREMDSQLRKKKLKLEGSDVPCDAGVSTDSVTLPSHVVHWIEPSMSMEQFIRMLHLTSPVSSSSKQSRKSELRGETSPDKTNLQRLSPENSPQKESTEIISRKRQNREDMTVPSETSAEMDQGDKTHVNLQTKSRAVTNTESQSDDESEGNFVLCGLHACGDLTATLLRLFVNCPQAVALNSVGCCYMKLSRESEDDRHVTQELGYPMSDFVRTISGHSLSYAALEMACHFVDSYVIRLKDNGSNLIVHSYRAALQQIILDKDPAFERGARKVTVKKAEQMDFTRYAEKGLQKIGLDPTLTASQLAEAQKQISQWKQVVAFYTIRLALAPMIETLVLLDRVQYLQEQGIGSTLLPVFDPAVSPRNFALLATKTIPDEFKGGHS